MAGVLHGELGGALICAQFGADGREYHETRGPLLRALPLEAEHWSLTALREKLVKIGAKVVRDGRYGTFQLAEVAVPRELFRKILYLIDDLRPRPIPV